MATARGRKFPTTVRCGFRPKMRAGRRIAMVAGFMNRITAGRGSPTSRGAGRHITTGAGSFTVAIGRGGPARCPTIPSTIPYGLRRMFPFSVGAEAASESVSASEVDLAASAGCRADPVIGITRGTGAGAAITVTKEYATDSAAEDFTTASLRSDAEGAESPISTKLCGTTAFAPDFLPWTDITSAGKRFRCTKAPSALRSSTRRGWSADGCRSSRRGRAIAPPAVPPIRVRSGPLPRHRSTFSPAATGQTRAALIAVQVSMVPPIATRDRLGKGGYRPDRAIRILQRTRTVAAIVGP